MHLIPLNRPTLGGKEQEYINKVINARQLAGNKEFTQKAQQFIQNIIGCDRVFLTHSCTDALEMSAILADIEPGDEIIMPSFTFPSTANAFVLRGGVPVFVDIRHDTLNIDENKIEEAITEKTKAIVPVHYAGVACEMDTILEIAKKHGLKVIEDAAQGIRASYKNKPLGGFGIMGSLSFHQSKNIISGEGGALLINDSQIIERAEIIWEKGTNRLKFFRGDIDEYNWVDVGSSYLPGELTAAFLCAQFDIIDDITVKRMKVWTTYHQAFEYLGNKEKVRRPIIPDVCQHNAHIYYLLLTDNNERNRLLAYLKDANIISAFHYAPLHLAPAAKKYAKASGPLPITENISERLIRLPIWAGLSSEDMQRVIETIFDFFKKTQK